MKRATVAVVGGTLTLVGLALLVLPGPGFVLVAVGLSLLATQFTWAARPLEYAKGKARVGMHEVATSRLRTAVAVLAALGLITAGIGGMTGVEIPFVTPVSAALLVVSGLVLVGTVVHARRTVRRAGAPPDATTDATVDPVVDAVAAADARRHEDCDQH